MSKISAKFNDKYNSFTEKFTNKYIRIIGIALAAVFVLYWLWDGIEFLSDISYYFERIKFIFDPFYYDSSYAIKEFLKIVTELIGIAGFNLFVICLAVYCLLAAFVKKSGFLNFAYIAVFVLGFLHYFNSMSGWLVYILSEISWLLHNFWFFIGDSLYILDYASMMFAMVYAVGAIIFKKVPIISALMAVLGSLSIVASIVYNLSGFLIITIHPNWSYSNPVITVISVFASVIFGVALIAVMLFLRPAKKEK